MSDKPILGTVVKGLDGTVRVIPDSDMQPFEAPETLLEREDLLFDPAENSEGELTWRIVIRQNDDTESEETTNDSEAEEPIETADQEQSSDESESNGESDESESDSSDE
ncbi:MAG: hypothetical protein Fur005_41210 [Roseiflexaceae bacterium]